MGLPGRGRATSTLDRHFLPPPVPTAARTPVDFLNGNVRALRHTSTASFDTNKSRDALTLHKLPHGRHGQNNTDAFRKRNSARVFAKALRVLDETNHILGNGDITVT